MDDRVPGTMAPEPNSMAPGWSLTQALEGATRRASPKVSLSRHLVGYRVATADDDAAVPHPGVPFDAAAAQPSPEDAALVARATQAGEASWAHERVSLIGRALDEEAKRLAADPQKAGSVAEHLAPMIEKAFVGAAAEAPGEYARAIVGREREPLETELLTERAVMSVAAKQRAEREARRAALEDELAMLREQPQRWHAISGRRGRAIDDLPFDEKRKTALKVVTARAQANAAAEGLLQQDAGWLLEDLDDPSFAGALGKDDTARWRSAAEEAVARRAETIAAESAERAQLAAVDMRTTLKRFKDKDDGPLPPREQIAAALGETAATELLSATLKGRKHRHAIGAAALLASVNEGAWLEAAPDKETRTMRELAVATKRAAVAGNPGRWLMQHSATLKELAQEATDDPAKLPRLVAQYTALRNQVSGRSGEASTGPYSGAKPDVGAAAELPPLPDEVAADLFEQVLASETPQARLDSLTTILKGAADGGSDTDDRARADAIARQLETLGLPEGTATRWAQLSDPQTRHSARLALLGGFAKQIAEETQILSGEGEEPEIVGEEGEDTIVEEQASHLHVIRERVIALVENGAIDQQTAARFLDDERLARLDEALNVQLRGNPDGPIDQETVNAISEAADWILSATELLAALEKEYGEFVHAVVLGARTAAGGSLKVFLGEVTDRGIDAAMSWFVDNYYNDAFDLVSRRLSETYGIDQETAERWTAAGTIVGITGIGIVVGARDLTKFARHFAGIRIRARGTDSEANDPIDPEIVKENQARLAQLDTSEIIKGSPRLYNQLALIIQNGTGRTSSEDIVRVMEGPEFDGLTQEAKEELARRLSRDIIGLATQDYVTDMARKLSLNRALQIMEDFGIRFDHRRPEPDLLLTDTGVDTTQLKKFTNVFIDLVKQGRVFLIEIKAGYGKFTGPQTYGYNRMKEAGVENAFLQLNVPIRMVPPEFIYRRLDGLIATGKLPNPPLDPRLVRQVVENLHQGLDPKTPVWVLNTLSVVALATIAEVPVAAFEEQVE
jgi:hypothetical protein